MNDILVIILSCQLPVWRSRGDFEISRNYFSGRNRDEAAPCLWVRVIK